MRTLRNKTEASLEFLKQEHNIAAAKVRVCLSVSICLPQSLPWCLPVGLSVCVGTYQCAECHFAGCRSDEVFCVPVC